MDLNTEPLASVVNALPYPAIVLDMHLRILSANAHADSLFETPLRGRDLVRVLREPSILECVEETQAKQGFSTRELEIRRRAVRTYQVSSGIVELNDQGDTGILLSLIDISAEIDAEKSRSTFVANVSHELRSPLTALMGIVETLRGPARNDEAGRDRFLGMMADETERMSRLVADLLSLSKLEAKEHVPPKGQVDLSVLLPKVVAVVSEADPDYRGRVEMSLAPNLPSISGDADELIEVFQNTIENALKYSRPGTPVNIEVRPAELSKYAVSVTITDQGDGIKAEHLPRLTERFYRVDTGRSREMGGTGLGLAIVKHILNRHLALLQIESEIGQGTSVKISFKA